MDVKKDILDELQNDIIELKNGSDNGASIMEKIVKLKNNLDSKISDLKKENIDLHERIETIHDDLENVDNYDVIRQIEELHKKIDIVNDSKMKLETKITDINKEFNKIVNNYHNIKNIFDLHIASLDTFNHKLFMINQEMRTLHNDMCDLKSKRTALWDTFI